LTVIVALFGLEGTASASSLARRGATYDGIGRQRHFLLAGTPGSPSGNFVIRFRVARNGRRVAQLHVWGLDAACAGKDGGYGEPSPEVGWARIRRDGRFRAVLRTNASSPIIFTGRFLGHRRARGALSYRGRGAARGCNADGVWTARVKPPPPPVQHFIGTTDEGTRVTFERTIERHPRVTRFSFGSLQTNCGTLIVATGPELGPPFDVQFSLPVVNGSFSGEYFYEVYVVNISGRFDPNDQTSGTVRYGDRGDCVTRDVHWTAHRAS
jgi:hypothetical protein